MADALVEQRADRRRVSLFIDVDNVLILAQKSGLPFSLPLIIDRARQLGTVMSSKAYADWTSNFLKPFLGDFRTNAIELVQLLTSNSSKEHKNTADIQLAVDALEMVFLPVRPDTIVIVGGDRDYVPLVQKLKRYGIFVVGIGVEAGASVVLVEACDSYIYYDDMVPPAPEEIAEPESLPDPEAAYSLMRRGVEALNREGKISTGASVHAMMKQLAPDFDLARFKTTLKDLAHDAQKAGHVKITENPGSDFTLAASTSTVAPATQLPEPTKREYDFSTTATITASYRTILQERRIPLLPWRIRYKFTRLIWEELDSRGTMGMNFDAMRRILLDYADSEGPHVSKQMVQKFLYTLNFARCFSINKDASEGNQISIPEDLYVPLFPVVNVEEAIYRLHRKYLEILASDAAILHPDSAFHLLYEDVVTDDHQAESHRAEVNSICVQIMPLGQVGQALVDAGRRLNPS